jgi:Na+/H+ antiporter NhaD/arsenite permease-like protein
MSKKVDTVSKEQIGMALVINVLVTAFTMMPLEESLPTKGEARRSVRLVAMAISAAIFMALMVSEYFAIHAVRDGGGLAQYLLLVIITIGIVLSALATMRLWKRL